MINAGWARTRQLTSVMVQGTKDCDGPLCVGSHMCALCGCGGGGRIDKGKSIWPLAITGYRKSTRLKTIPSQEEKWSISNKEM